MNKETRKHLGDYGEGLALKAYKSAGYTLLDAQYRCRFGEIDLIVSKAEWIVFVEVRTKTSSRYGTAEESITEKKKNTIRKVSQFYMMQNNYLSRSVQYDVVGIYIDKKEKKAWMNRIPQAF